MTDYTDIMRRLREQAVEIARAGHNGWGNASSDAADAIEALLFLVQAAEAGRESFRLRNEELVKELDEALAAWKKSHRDGYAFAELYRETKARVAELERIERLIRLRCEGWLCVPYKPYGRHAPECLVEEAGIK